MFKPNGRRILVEPRKNKVSGDGIVITGRNDEAEMFGTVMAVGNKQHDVKVGDVVLYKGIGKNWVTFDNRRFVLCSSEEDIIAIVEE